jgi:formylglycine-generating enzyme
MAVGASDQRLSLGVIAMRSRRRLLITASVALFLATLAISAAHAITIDWVTVGDPGNAADTTGNPNPAGAVADSFQIMKFEFTNQQYTDFLNSVDRTGTNPNAVYSGNMGGARGGINFTPFAPLGRKYDVRSNMGNKPVNFVSWFDAARVSNWLFNGATGTSSTETGAYTLVGGGGPPAVNPGATFYIPTEDQWYKAAYYKGSGTNAGYWDYATQSDTAPTAVNATTEGAGTSGGVSPVTSGNFANYTRAANWNGQLGNLTTVGTNGGASAYGAFDMSGNVYEWTSLTGAAGSPRWLRGGGWPSNAFDLSSSNRSDPDPASESSYGFRLASPVPVPEPSTWVMGLAGIACAGWGRYRRRRAA